MNVVKHFATSTRMRFCGFWRIVPTMLPFLGVNVVACGGVAPSARVDPAPAESSPAPLRSAQPVASSDPAASCAPRSVDPAAAACLARAAGPATDCAVKLARAKVAGGEEQAAVDVLAAAIRKHPAEKSGYLELALLLQTNNRYDLATGVLTEALKFVPPAKTFLVHYLLAGTRAAEDDVAGSIAHLEAAHRLLPNDAEVGFSLALAYTRAAPRREAEAKALLEPLVAGRCGEDPAPMCGLAQATLARIAQEEPWPSADPRLPTSAYGPSACEPPPVAGAAPMLPWLALPSDPVRSDSAFTVWGATHHLRSAPHRKGVTAGPIRVVGYVVATNYDLAPACAVHRVGAAEPPGCTGPLPTFYLTDDLERPTSVLPVMGWVSNWASLHDAMVAIDNDGDAADLTDVYYGTDLPSPIPQVGARVRVTGTLDFSFIKARRRVVEPRFGILSFESLVTEKSAPERATLPGMQRH